MLKDQTTRLADQFLVEPGVHHLNNGSFGGTPKPVLDEYRRWQERMEKNPTRFYLRELRGHYEQARSVLAELVGAQVEHLAFVPNATVAVNLVARSANFGPEDEVLSTNHEYGACARAWEFLSGKRGFRYIPRHVPLPLGAPGDVADAFWEGVTPNTRLIMLSHITSPTAVHFPVQEICRRARGAGILTLIDGAHAVGQIDLNLEAIGADFYTSNAHKWLCAPKVSAFLHARPEVHSMIEPLIVSWGWGESREIPFGSDFLDILQWPGTWNTAAYLSVPAAIRFQGENNWPAVRRECHALLADALNRLTALEGVESVYRSEADYVQMGAVMLPQVDAKQFERRLWEEFQVEAPVNNWSGRQFLRFSVQAYNSETDLDAGVRAVQELLQTAG